MKFQTFLKCIFALALRACVYICASAWYVLSISDLSEFSSALMKDQTKSKILLLFSLLVNISQANTLLAAKQTKADVCPNPEGNQQPAILPYELNSSTFVGTLVDNACLFALCDNGGVCIEDPNTLDCYRCQCATGYTGKFCESTFVISRKIIYRFFMIIFISLISSPF